MLGIRVKLLLLYIWWGVSIVKKIRNDYIFFLKWLVM